MIAEFIINHIMFVLLKHCLNHYFFLKLYNLNNFISIKTLHMSIIHSLTHSQQVYTQFKNIFLPFAKIFNLKQTFCLSLNTSLSSFLSSSYYPPSSSKLFNFCCFCLFNLYLNFIIVAGGLCLNERFYYFFVV